MFTGIIKNFGILHHLNSKDSSLKIVSNFSEKIKLGESISCSGVCLTVSKVDKNIFWVNVSEETNNKTNFSKLKVGDKLNLEKSLKIGDDLGGHLVFGHVDEISKIVEIKNQKDFNVIKLNLHKNISKFMTPKCSITLNGISLTVNEVDGDLISLTIIPYTWENTNLKDLKVGSLLNTEVDMLARYVFKALKK